MKAAIINTEPYHNVKIKHHTPSHGVMIRAN